MSSLIVELVNAIYTNGNAKFYFGNTREKVVHLINFEVDQTGKLSIRSKMEEYDQKFSDGKSINPNAKLKSSFDVTDIDYAENKLDIIISEMLDWSLYLQQFKDYNLGTFITSQQNDGKPNTVAATKKVFDMAISMLDPNPNILRRIATEYGKIDASGISGMFLSNRQEKRVLESKPSEFTQVLDREFSIFLDALNLAYEEYIKMQNDGVKNKSPNR